MVQAGCRTILKAIINSMKAYLTLLSSANYLRGLLVLHRSLKAHQPSYPLIVWITDEVVKSNPELLDILDSQEVQYEFLEDTFEISESAAAEFSSHRWGATFDKLKLFSMTQFEKIVLLDSDMLITKNIDHLFDLPHLTSCCESDLVTGFEDWSLPNSGMMVIEPEEGLGQKVFDVWPVVQQRKPIFGDQDLIHEYFRAIFTRNEDWRIPAKFNCFTKLTDQIIAERGYNLNLEAPDDGTIAILHFCIHIKPWLATKTQRAELYENLESVSKTAEIRAHKLYDEYLAKVDLALSEILAEQA